MTTMIFAKVLNGVVTDVRVVADGYFDTFVDTSPGEWVQCWYNVRGGVHYLQNNNVPKDDQSKAFSKNYPGIGYEYDGIGFSPPKPWPSWQKNPETYYYEAPTPMPCDGGSYAWNESTQQWASRQ